MSPSQIHPHTSPQTSSYHGENSAPVGKQVMLIVDDNDFIQQSMQLLLTKMGVGYESCTNGLLAVEKFEEYLKEGKMFDIILMDLLMSIMDGYTASQ